MFRPSDLYRAFRDLCWPMSGTNPALTRRVLRRCRQHPVMITIDTVSLAILAELEICTAGGPVPRQRAALRRPAQPRARRIDLPDAGRHP